MALSRSDFTYNNVFSVVVAVFIPAIFVGIFGIFVAALVRIANPSGPGTGHVELDESSNLYRTRVPGGWTYYFQNGGMVFVPEATIAAEGSGK